MEAPSALSTNRCSCLICSPSTTTVLGMSSRRGMFGFGSSGPMGFHTEARHPLNARNTTRDEPRMG